MNTTPRFYPSQPRVYEQKNLPAAALRVLDYLEKRTRGLAEWWESAETIAAKLGLAVRTVQAALAELAKAGLTALRRDYNLKTRRAIVLLWRQAAQPVESTPQPRESAHVVDRVELHVDPLPQVAPRAEAEAPREPEAPAVVAAPLEAVEVTGTTGRKATAEEVAKLIDDAGKLGGADPVRVKALAKRCGLGVVSAAVAEALRSGASRFGWVEKCAAAWAEEGIPDHAKTAEQKAVLSESLSERLDRKIAELMTQPKTTDAQLEEMTKAWYRDNEWWYKELNPGAY